MSQLGVHRRLGLAAGGSVANAGWQVLVNGQLETDPDRLLKNGDRIAILPPLAGG